MALDPLCVFIGPSRIGKTTVIRELAEAYEAEHPGEVARIRYLEYDTSDIRMDTTAKLVYSKMMYHLLSSETTLIVVDSFRPLVYSSSAPASKGGINPLLFLPLTGLAEICRTLGKTMLAAVNIMSSIAEIQMQYEENLRGAVPSTFSVTEHKIQQYRRLSNEYIAFDRRASQPEDTFDQSIAYDQYEGRPLRLSQLLKG